uniref:Uncharacterized protein n=1 Tax=Arundo donax TaxID=35708 RepID=A0A0A8YX49_ARUDO
MDIQTPHTAICFPGLLDINIKHIVSNVRGSTPTLRIYYVISYFLTIVNVDANVFS